ncbi:unnamed protein product [Brassica oleracea var. botrytis]
MRLDSTRIENFLLKDLCTRLVVSTLHVATTSFVSLMPLSPFDSLMVQSDELTEFDKSIPTEMFRFQSYDQLLALADTNRQLPAFAFAEKMTRNGREPKVVLITSINPKVVGGRLFLNGTSGTHIYFDSQLQAKNAIHSELFGDGSNQISSSSKLIHAQKIVPLTVSELNQYVLSADPQVIEFLCTAKVTGIQFEEEYIGCASCSKKLPSHASLVIKKSAVASLRYRVELSVADNTGDAVFVAFDLDMAKLTNIPAAEAAEVIVGSCITFQIKLGEFNFTFKHQTFTISRIFSVAQRAPLPDFVGDGAQHDPNDGLQVQNPISSLVPVCNSSTIVETSGGMAAELGASTDKEDQTSSSAAPVEGPSATSTPPVEAEESKNKKPRLA